MRLCQIAEAYASPLGPRVGTQRGSAASSDAAAAAAGQPNSWANLAGRLMGEARCHLKYRCNATELGCCAHTYHHLSRQHATERSDPMYYLSNALCSLDSSPEPVSPPYGLFIHSFICEHAFLSTSVGFLQPDDHPCLQRNNVENPREWAKGEWPPLGLAPPIPLHPPPQPGHTPLAGWSSRRPGGGGGVECNGLRPFGAWVTGVGSLLSLVLREKGPTRVRCATPII